MCNECRQYPCSSRCPNAPEHIVCNCIHCDGEIYRGETYYDIDGEPWCEDCVKSARTCAEED